MEHFQDSCQDPISWIQENTYYLEFAEGWALYAENPLISKYTDTYENDPLTKYGMLKWQVFHMHCTITLVFNNYSIFSVLTFLVAILRKQKLFSVLNI